MAGEGAGAGAGASEEAVTCALSLCEELLYRNPLPEALEAEAAELMPEP